MDTIIFLPGGGGSKLQLQGQEIWPPFPWEFVFGYSRLPQFLNPNAKPSGIVGSILLYQTYDPILADLRAIAAQMNATLVEFPYDFRKSVLRSTAKLAAEIESRVNAGAQSITLVAHSTGNQVARAVLESRSYQAQGWFQGLKRYVGVCGPHYGSPEVTEYTLGLTGWLSISRGDMQTISRDHRFPGCYQLLPYQRLPVPVAILLDVNTGPKDFYVPAVANFFALDDVNLGSASTLQRRLTFRKPAGVDYDLAAANGFSTDQTMRYDGHAPVNILQVDGDGTLALWTAGPPQFNPFVTPGSHIDVLKSYPFRDFLYTLLTGGTLIAPFFLDDLPGIALCLDRTTYLPGERMAVMLIPDKKATEIVGALKLERAADPDAHKLEPYKEPQPFVYRGLPVGSIAVDMTAPEDTGVYRLSFEGETLKTAPQTAVAFAVSTVTGRRPKG